MNEENPIRLQILRKAREQFCTHGFSRVTTDDLASELGISKKTLYQHFASKEELVRAVVYAMRDEMAGAVAAIVENDDLDVVEKFRTLMTTVGTKLTTMRRPYFEDLRRKAPDLWGEIEQFRRERILTSFDRLITEGSRNGMLRSGIDPHLFVLMFYAVIQNIFNPEVLSQLAQTPDEAFAMVVTVLIEGVLSDEAKTRYYSTEAGQTKAASRTRRTK
jgi:AcrR family transcriptional regulator